MCGCVEPSWLSQDTQVEWLVIESRLQQWRGVQVVDGGSMGSRRHLNIRGKSANLPAITERDWRDIDFGIRMGVDFYALSFVRDAACIYELQTYLKRHDSTAKVLPRTA